MSENEIGIEPLLIQDEMKSCYLDYAMSVIVGRALPDVRDGLKPVHRRILYSMHSLNNTHQRPFVKSARVVGEVIGKYHPHGDSSVYSAIVRLAQDFSMRYTIVDGQGNFGSIDGDNAAAMRYTEIRMKKISSEILQDIDKETVDWQPNYDDSLLEPKVFPTKIPNLLINGSTGIAVGMATNIPPHNLTEVLKGLMALVDNPDLEMLELLKIIQGPDFPTGGIIYGTEGILSAYKTGKGVIQIRGRAVVEENEKNGRQRIIITELPYQVNKAKLIEKMAYYVNQKEIQGISDIRDESNRLGIRIVVELKKGEQGRVILNRLYKQTQLQVSYGIILLSLHNGVPKVMTIKEVLQHFVVHRKEIIVRRTNYNLKRAKEKAHILEGLKIAVENMDAIIVLIKESESPSTAKSLLQKKYDLSEKQSQAILDMKLQRLTGLERDKIVKDYNDILELIKSLEQILASEELVYKIIRDEFEEILEKYGDDRKTEIQSHSQEIFDEDLIKKEEVLITITHKGYIKRMALDTYKSQKRGGKGVKGAELDEDFFTNIYQVHTHTRILVITDKGTSYSLKAFTIPEGSRTAKGRNIVNMISLPKDERVREIVPIPDEEEGKYLLICTAKGIVKKTALSGYKNAKLNGLKAIKVQDNDSVISVRVVEVGQDILLCSSGGKTIRFSESDLRDQGRVSQGVKGITLTEKEKLIGMEIVDDTMDMLTITEKGYGKRTKAGEYRCQTRGGKGIMAMKLNERTGEIIQIKPVNESDDIVIISNNGQVIRMNVEGISLLGRATQGVRLINLKDGESVVAIEKLIV